MKRNKDKDIRMKAFIIISLLLGVIYDVEILMWMYYKNIFDFSDIFLYYYYIL